jgi:hypothetical protein
MMGEPAAPVPVQVMKPGRIQCVWHVHAPLPATWPICAPLLRDLWAGNMALLPAPLNAVAPAAALNECWMVTQATCPGEPARRRCSGRRACGPPSFLCPRVNGPASAGPLRTLRAAWVDGKPPRREATSARLLTRCPCAVSASAGPLCALSSGWETTLQITAVPARLVTLRLCAVSWPPPAHCTRATRPHRAAQS